MSDFFDRLDKYMKIKGLNDNQLTNIANLSIGNLGKQRKGTRGLNNKSIEKILLNCPDLNAEWLLTGKGEMLRTTQPVSNILSEYSDDQPQELIAQGMQEELLRVYNSGQAYPTVIVNRMLADKDREIKEAREKIQQLERLLIEQEIKNATIEQQLETTKKPR